MAAVSPEPWYRVYPEAFGRSVHEALDRQPGLRLEETKGAPVLRGVFKIRDGKAVVDQYQIELEPPQDSERGIPVVREIGGRIPRIANRHVNETDGALCVVLPEAYWFDHPNGLSLGEFLDGPLRDHLAGQSLVDLGEPWPAGEWAHGEDGILEFYSGIFGTSQPGKIQGFVELLARREVKGHWDCPCGSGKRLRKCHGPKVLELRARLPRLVAARLLERLPGRPVESERQR